MTREQMKRWVQMGIAKYVGPEEIEFLGPEHFDGQPVVVNRIRMLKSEVSGDDQQEQS
jgi:hypothetical protein